jgi:hypothetical protein
MPATGRRRGQLNAPRPPPEPPTPTPTDWVGRYGVVAQVKLSTRSTQLPARILTPVRYCPDGHRRGVPEGVGVWLSRLNSVVRAAHLLPS